MNCDNEFMVVPWKTMLLVAVRVPQATPPLAEMLATVMLGVPVSPEATVAVAALPVQLPALPVTLPVTLPVSGPEKPAAITVPVERMDPETSREYAGVIVPMPT